MYVKVGEKFIFLYRFNPQFTLYGALHDSYISAASCPPDIIIHCTRHLLHMGVIKLMSQLTSS